MATKVKAKMGDTLCNIAHLHGFGDCTPLRSDPANAFVLNRADFPGEVFEGDEITVPDLQAKEESGGTEQQHKFVKRANAVTIRYVHGSPTIPYLQDSTVSTLNISKYTADRAGGPDGSRPLPNDSVRLFHADGHNDPDTFKVELTDIRGSGNLDVEIEPLRPKYDASGKVIGHEPFPGAIKDARKLKTIATKQGSSKAFRTCYLKLVTDEEDQGKIPKQSVLVADMHDDGDSKVEILDQLVKASYEIKTCPGSPKCKASVTAPIGTDRRRLRVKVHVLNQAPGDPPIVTLDAAEMRVFKWLRRCYAQAGLAPKLIEAVVAVDPPANLVSIANDSGVTAAGDGTLGFTIHSDAEPDQVVGPITPNAGDTPLQTANRLAAEVKAPYSARVSQNPARFVDPVDQRSADIVITEASGSRVEIDTELSNDSRQTLTVGVVDPINFESWAFPAGNNNWNVGSLMQRTVLKNYKDQVNGDDRVDIFVIDQLTAGNRAEAMMSNHRIDATLATVRGIRYAAFMASDTMDDAEGNPFVLGHEIGHVAAELVHAPATAAPGLCQIMDRRGTEVANAFDASKRMRAGAVRYDAPAGDFNIIERIRIEGRTLLEPY